MLISRVTLASFLAASFSADTTCLVFMQILSSAGARYCSGRHRSTGGHALGQLRRNPSFQSIGFGVGGFPSGSARSARITRSTYASNTLLSCSHPVKSAASLERTC